MPFGMPIRHIRSKRNKKMKQTSLIARSKLISDKKDTKHYRAILKAMRKGSNYSCRAIAQRCSLTDVQIARRMKEMEFKGLVVNVGALKCDLYTQKVTHYRKV